MSYTPPPLSTMMSQLIATPSVSSTNPQLDQSNYGVVNLLANWLSDLQFRVEVIPIPGKPDKANLIAALGSGDGGLVLAGHCDTVPCDANLWQRNPFELVERDGCWFGLGTCDMKGFFALAIAAIGHFRGSDLGRPLIVLATADEESSMSGARALQSAQLCGAVAAIIGEPTGLTPIWQTKGVMMIKIRVEGKSGHSSDPDLGKSALDAMAVVLQDLLGFRAELQRRDRNPAFRIESPTMNLGCIHGGDNPNRICDHVELEIDVRILPGMDNQKIREELDRRMQALAGKLDLRLTVELLHSPLPPFSANLDSRLLSVTEQITGNQRSTAAFGSEAPFLQGLGMDTVLLGPGYIEQAHQPNEFIRQSQLEPTIDIIRRLIHHHCGH